MQFDKKFFENHFMLRPILVEELQNNYIFTNNIRWIPKELRHRYPKFNREFCNCSSELLLCSSIRRFYRRPACMQRKQIEVKSTAASRVEIGQVWHDSVLMMESRPQVQTLSWSNEGSKTRESEILPRQQQYSRIYKDVWCSRNTLKSVNSNFTLAARSPKLWQAKTHFLWPVMP